MYDSPVPLCPDETHLHPIKQSMWSSAAFPPNRGLALPQYPRLLHSPCQPLAPTPVVSLSGLPSDVTAVTASRSPPPPLLSSKATIHPSSAQAYAGMDFGREGARRRTELRRHDGSSPRFITSDSVPFTFPKEHVSSLRLTACSSRQAILLA